MTDRTTVACVATLPLIVGFHVAGFGNLDAPVSCKNLFLAEVCAGPMLNSQKQSAASTYRLTVWIHGSNDNLADLEYGGQ